MSTDKEDKNLCGYGIFTLPEDHPFTVGCQLSHDPAYRAYLDGFNVDLEKADKAFLNFMLGVAREKKSLRLRAEAYVFYGLVTAFRLAFRSK